ncbi:hypothetical protein F4859DRAFT_433689 [Xylaria cf. heliscus]|nr:hypothetical protein F4859DRAFT_433689 [Xylaria cf. heliscus]
MRFLIAALIWLSSYIAVRAQKPSFISPQWQDTTSKAPFAGNSRWPLGSSQIIAFTSPWESYRIEFWQGILSGGARKSKQLVYNQSKGETLPQSFYWTVQTYDLQLEQSPVFFFWLFDNNNSTNQQSSANFNITIDTITSSSRSSPPSATTSSSSVSRSPSTTTTTPSGTPSPSSIAQSATPVSSGLSRSAAAGIGVGAALGGVIVVAGAVFLFWKMKRRRNQRKLQGPGPTTFPSDSPGAAAVPTDGYYAKPVEAAGDEWIVEAPHYHDRGPVEMG